MSVNRVDKDLIAERGNATIHLAAAGRNALRNTAAIMPDGPPRSQVKRSHIARRIGDVHHAVEHERRGFKMLPPANLIQPRDFQPGDICTVNLFELGVMMRGVIARISEPILRLAISLAN